MHTHPPLQAAGIATHPLPTRPAWERLATRPFRVVALSAAILAMSIVDLYLTILYLTHTGMSEANPLARAIIAYQSPLVLALWKLTTVAFSVGILFLVRHRRSAEVGAWVGFLVLGLLMSHWTRYITELSDLKAEIGPTAMQMDDAWVFFDPAPATRRTP